MTTSAKITALETRITNMEAQLVKMLNDNSARATHTKLYLNAQIQKLENKIEALKAA